MKAKDETIKFYSVNNEQVLRHQNNYKEELEKVNSEKQELNSKIRDLQRNIDELYVNRKSEAAMVLEVEHLKEDNIRLLQLLKTTNEFKDFAYLSEDVSGGIRFVRSYENKVKARPKSTTSRVKNDRVDPRNNNNWVPMDVRFCFNNLGLQFCF
jgi:predicted RNase H-like nuclease (RuvC/YqgF family)